MPTAASATQRSLRGGLFLRTPTQPPHVNRPSGHRVGCRGAAASSRPRGRPRLPAQRHADVKLPPTGSPTCPRARRPAPRRARPPGPPRRGAGGTLFSLVCAVSLLVCAAALAGWARSYWVRDEVTFAGPAGGDHVVYSTPAASTGSPPPPAPAAPAARPRPLLAPRRPRRHPPRCSGSSAGAEGRGCRG
jgi:hypothetical protein